MATSQDYALLSLDVYFDETRISGSLLSNWQAFDVSFPEAADAEAEGFFARAYKNTDTGEIVIVYRGTDQIGGLHPRRRIAIGKQPENFVCHRSFPATVGYSRRN